MSAELVQRPVYRLHCDRMDCPAWFEAEHDFDRAYADQTRLRAGEAGWDVPPYRGKGSRRGTDFCPQHGWGGGS